MATILQLVSAEPPAKRPTTNGNSSLHLSGAPQEDPVLWHHQVIRERDCERSRRHKWLKPWHRRSDRYEPPRLPHLLPNDGELRPRQSTAADSGIDAGTTTPVTVSASAASRETRRSGLSKRRQQPGTASADTSSAAELQAQIVPVSGIPVEVRLRVLDRLRKLELASSLGLRADRMAEFTASEQQKLVQFQLEFNRVRIDWFRGRPMPNVRFELVALMREGTNPQSSGTPASGDNGGTSICIRGLQTDDEIKEFHRVMSRDFVRRLYKPLRLSYDMSLIRTAAKETDDMYEYRPSPYGDTLCGTILHTTTAGGSGFMSTIGGIVNAGGILYAITTSHHPNNEPQPGSLSPSSMSGESTLIEGEYGDDVESPLVLDHPKIDPERTENDSERPLVPTHFWASLGVDPGRPVMKGDDWRLVPISGTHCLPNSFPRTLLPPSSDSWLPASSLKEMYITKYLEAPSRKTVNVLSDFARPFAGTLLSSPSFLSIHGGPAEEVWTAVFERHVLKKGDSGSWVVDDHGVLVGMVRAFSEDQGYIVPFSVQKQDIVSQIPGLVDVTLPSPLQCWLEVASARYRDSPDMARDASRNALSQAVLKASHSIDPLARTLESAQLELVASRLDERLLEEVLSRDGNKLREFLDGYSPRDRSHRYTSELHQRLKDIHTRLHPPANEEDSAVSGPQPPDTRQEPTQVSVLNTNEVDAIGAHEISQKLWLWQVSVTRFLIYNITMITMSTVAGLCAALAYRSVTGHSVPGDVGLIRSGATIGASLAAPAVAWWLLLFLQKLPILREWRLGPSLFLDVVAWVLWAVLYTAIVFLRPLLALEVASRVVTTGIFEGNMPALRIASIAAAAPLWLDTAFTISIAEPEPILHTGIKDEPKESHRFAFQSKSLMYWLGSIGWDALAGYTFVKVASNYDVGVATEAGAAAAGATFGAVGLSWVLLASVIELLVLRLGPYMKERKTVGVRKKTEHVVNGDAPGIPEMLENNRPVSLLRDAFLGERQFRSPTIFEDSPV